MKRTSRKPSKLSSSLQRHLNAYALAASAAGVGVLALAQPAEAKIVYIPAHHVFYPGNGTYNLDLNHDGIVDFQLNWVDDSSVLSLWLGREGKNQMVGYHDRTNSWASALPSGVRVSTDRPFLPESGGMFDGHCSNSCYSIGPWVGVQNRYLGLKFYVKGEPHYGWARLSTTPVHNPRPILTGYAYETIPNKAIITGKTKGRDVITLAPGNLGALAAGHRGRSH